MMAGGKPVEDWKAKREEGRLEAEKWNVVLLRERVKHLEAELAAERAKSRYERLEPKPEGKENL